MLGSFCKKHSWKCLHSGAKESQTVNKLLQPREAQKGLASSRLNLATLGEEERLDDGGGGRDTRRRVVGVSRDRG